MLDLTSLSCNISNIFLAQDVPNNITIQGVLSWEQNTTNIIHSLYNDFLHEAPRTLNATCRFTGMD